MFSIIACVLFNPVGVGHSTDGRTQGRPSANPSLRMLNAFGVPDGGLSVIGGASDGVAMPSDGPAAGRPSANPSLRMLNAFGVPDGGLSVIGGAAVGQAVEKPAGHVAASGMIILEDRPGPGKLIEAGDKVVLQYQVWDGTGRELADSAKRGMPFTMVLGRRNSDPLFSVALAGMHAGGVRTAQIPAGTIPEGIGSIIPPNTDLKIWIFAVAAKSGVSAVR